MKKINESHEKYENVDQNSKKYLKLSKFERVENGEKNSSILIIAVKILPILGSNRGGVSNGILKQDFVC